jgi:hypothetical protein
MGGFSLFLIRLVLSLLFAFLATRIFFGQVAHIKVFGLAMILLALAYLFEYLRKREKGGEHGSEKS